MAVDEGRLGGVKVDHELKIWPSHFAAVKEGRKTFEIRRADRDYQVGDTLKLEEWDPGVQANFERPTDEAYTGRALRARIVYLLHVGAFTVKYPIVVLGIADVEVLEDANA